MTGNRFLYVDMIHLDHGYQVSDIGLLYYEKVYQEKPEADYDTIRLELKNDILYTSLFNENLEKKSIYKQVDVENVRELKWEVKRQVYIILSACFGQERPWGVLTGIRPAKKIHEYIDRGFTKTEMMDMLVKEDFVSVKKADLLYEVAISERKVLDRSLPNDVSLYIGIPFCPSICHYCSFSSYPVNSKNADPAAYIAAMKIEGAYVADIIRKRGERIKNVYIGGGTPTSISIDTLFEMMENLKKTFDFSSVTEYTVEAGRPDSMSKEKLMLLKSYGVERISVNPQSMNQRTLDLIGRKHTVSEAIEGYYLARETGFEIINMDIIAGLPGESFSDFEKTLDDIYPLSPNNLTVHALAIKRASRLNQNKDEYNIPNSIDVEKMIELSNAYAERMNMKPYYLYRQRNIAGFQENIGFSTIGQECEYNIQIMEERQTIYSIGAGGVTKVISRGNNRVERIFNYKDPKIYISKIKEVLNRKALLADGKECDNIVK